MVAFQYPRLSISIRVFRVPFVKTSPCRCATSLSFRKERDVLAMPKQGEVNFAHFVVMQKLRRVTKT